MFLKSLTLKGFKSFADATTLDFEPGVTVVVGPERQRQVQRGRRRRRGCSAPRRRARCARQKMDDVIFAGTAKRAGARPRRGRRSRSTTRRASCRSSSPRSRSPARCSAPGDSEYAINGVPCRLLDIQELLSDTGVGRQQHVIVSRRASSTRCSTPAPRTGG